MNMVNGTVARMVSKFGVVIAGVNTSENMRETIVIRKGIEKHKNAIEHAIL